MIIISPFLAYHNNPAAAISFRIGCLPKPGVTVTADGKVEFTPPDALSCEYLMSGFTKETKRGTGVEDLQAVVDQLKTKHGFALGPWDLTCQIRVSTPEERKEAAASVIRGMLKESLWLCVVFSDQ